MVLALNTNEQEAFDRFMSHFSVIGQPGEQIQCKCPSCDHDKLYITAKDSRSNPGTHQVMLKCFHGCEYKDILKAAGIEPKELYLTRTQRLSKDRCADKRQHIYNDQNGQPAFRKTMWKFHSYYEYNGNQTYPGGKQVFWEHYETGFGWTKGKASPLLYHLDKLHGNVVYIPEGEKDVDTLEKLGYIATTNGGGCKEDWKKAKYLEQLRSIKTALILADNDPPGKEHAQKVAQYLTGGGIECKVIEAAAIYPEVQNKGDISDIVGAVGAEKAKELLDAAVNAATVYQMPAVTEQSTPARAEDINVDGTGKLTIANFRAFLKREGITIRLDELARIPKFSGNFKGHNKDYITEIASTLFRDTLQTELKGATLQTIESLILVEACDHPFNPVLDILNKAEYDGKDRITEIFKHLGIFDNDDLSMRVLRLWLYQCYCGLHNRKDDPFCLDICLVLKGAQGAGKTRFLEKLAINTCFFGEGVALDPTDKDSVIHSTSTWICELGEVSSTLSKDMNRLKAFTTLSTDRYRPPYGRVEVNYPRRTSFCGSTNDEKFLTDITGSRRFVVIPLSPNLRIDMAWLKQFDAVQLWKQVQSEVEEILKQNPEKKYEDVFRIPPSELSLLAARNAEYTTYLPGEEEVRDILSDLNNSGATRRMTVTEFIEDNRSLARYRATQISKVLRKLGYNSYVAKVGKVSTRVYDIPT